VTKLFHNDVMDKGLEQIQNSANWSGASLSLVLCSAAPATLADASTLHPTGMRVSDAVAMAGGDLTIADKAGGGREVTVAAKSGTVQVNIPTIDSGTASAGGATTLTDSSQAWTVNAYANKVVKITAGTGVGQVRGIASNTATILTVDAAWSVTPDITSTYEVLEDLHYALYDGTRLLYVSDETSNQALTLNNPINFPSFKFGFNDPV